MPDFHYKHACYSMYHTLIAYLLPVDRHQAAEVLIKEGQADLDAEDTMGRTALSHAAKYGSTDCMNLLANCHADVFHKDHDGKTPVQIAEGSLNPRTETVNLLRRYQQVCIVDYFNTDTLYRHTLCTSFFTCKFVCIQKAHD